MDCDAPVNIKLDPPVFKDGSWLYNFPTGCGKCIPCLMKRKSQWSLRINHEAKNAFSSYFVTLTYNDEHLPYSDFNSIINSNDHRHFIKWLRFYETEKQLQKRNTISSEEILRKQQHVICSMDGRRKPLKYFGVSELGGRYGRPHWHYILLNVVDIENIRKAWSETNKVAKGVYKPGKPFGNIQIDECNINTIDYVLKYMVKERNEDIDVPEKSYMSKGLGLSYLNNEIINHIKKPEGNQLLNDRGTKIGVPRYFQKKVLTDNERKLKILHISSEVQAANIEDFRKAERMGINYDLQKAQGKDNRKNNLKQTKKRKDL